MHKLRVCVCVRTTKIMHVRNIYLRDVIVELKSDFTLKTQ